jgi:hypothetical protein
MAVSTDFAPPFKLIAPYFKIGGLVFVFSILLLFGFDVSNLTTIDIQTLSWVHIFLLGFVMMIIFGAMAQLVPVVLEVGHAAIDLYYVIYPLLFIGTTLMGWGFYESPQLLPYGGIVVLISLLIFVFETFLTIKKVAKFNLVMTTVLIANTFLFIGLIFGILMALSYAGTISADIQSLLKAHIYLVLVGYVGITIMGMSLVLLPMFWLSHSFSWKPVVIALWLISLGVTSVTISTLISNVTLEYIGYALSLIASILYTYQIYIIYKTRVRIEKDIYLDSMVISYGSLFLSVLLGITYIFVPNEILLVTIGWTLFLGYVSFVIIGHLYKIVPFLVWFERFSPLVGKEKVPMLADMVPVKSAKMQFRFSAIGILISAIGILSTNNTIFDIGISFLFIGSIFMIKDLFYMINFK